MWHKLYLNVKKKKEGKRKNWKSNEKKWEPTTVKFKDGALAV